MVAVERHESGHLHPPIAKLFVGVALEATCIRTDEWYLENLELEDALDVEVHVLPLADIVAQPVARPFARASKG